MYRYLLTLLFTVILLSAMNQKELAVAIDHSVRQSVRTQKIVKEALLINMQIDTQKNAQNMKYTIDMLNKDLNQFLGKTKGEVPEIKNKDILTKIKEFEKKWKEVEQKAKKIYNLNYTQEDIKYLANSNMELLLKNRAIVLAIVKQHKEDTDLKLANDIKIAGKQRMLVQMVSKDILMYLNNFEKKASLKDLQKNIKEIDYNFNALFNGDKKLKCVGVNLPNIINQLKKAQNIWDNTKPLITKALKNKDKKLIKELIDNLDTVRVNMKESVALYTNSLNREKQVVALNKIINSFYKINKKIKHIVDIAGKQRMLSQRMSKLAIECSYNLTQDSCSKLQIDRDKFSEVLNLFKKIEKSDTIESDIFKGLNKELENIEDIWTPFDSNIKKIIQNGTNNKDKKALNYILSNSNKLLKSSNNLVSKILDIYNTKITEVERTKLKIINLTGKTRMLSQKMTKEFLEKHILKNKSAEKNLNKTISIYNQILNALIKGDVKLEIPKISNKEIEEELFKVEKLWKKVEPIYQKNYIESKELQLILKANIILLKEMDKAVQLMKNLTDY